MIESHTRSAARDPGMRGTAVSFTSLLAPLRIERLAHYLVLPHGAAAARRVDAWASRWVALPAAPPRPARLHRRRSFPAAWFVSDRRGRSPAASGDQPLRQLPVAIPLLADGDGGSACWCIVAVVVVLAVLAVVGQILMWFESRQKARGEREVEPWMRRTSLPCPRCGGLALPLPQTEDRYDCVTCRQRLAGPPFPPKPYKEGDPAPVKQGFEDRWRELFETAMKNASADGAAAPIDHTEVIGVVEEDDAIARRRGDH